MADSPQTKLFPWKDLRLLIRKKLRLGNQGAITGIDVDGQVLRVVQTAPRGNRGVVTRLATERLDFPNGTDCSDPAALGKAIADALDRLGIQPAGIVMGVPRASVVIRTLSVPATEDISELASMVHFQIGKDLPIRLEDAVIDFKVRRQVSTPPRLEPNDPTYAQSAENKADPAAALPKLEVLAAAVRRDVVRSFQQTADAAGLNLVALGWPSDAHARCVEACRVAPGDEAVALVSLRLDEVGIDVIAKQTLLFSRGVSVKLMAEPEQPVPTSPAPPLPDAGRMNPPPTEAPAMVGPASFVETITIEVVRSLHSYGGIEPHLPVSKLFVAGATGQELAVVEALKNRLNIPCNLLDPTSALGLPEVSRGDASGSISALGLALGVSDPQGLSFDFLNPKRPAVQRNMRRIRIIAAAAAVAVMLFGVLGVRSRLMNQRVQINRQVQADLTAAEKKRPIFRQMRLQATTLQEWVKAGSNTLDHYAYLSAILPGSEEIYVSSLAISGQGVIRFAVQARSGEVLAKLDKQLRAAGYDVKPLAIVPGNDKFSYDFRSTVELAAPEKMKIDLAGVHPPVRPADDASSDPPGKGNRKGARP